MKRVYKKKELGRVVITLALFAMLLLGVLQFGEFRGITGFAVGINDVAVQINSSAIVECLSEGASESCTLADITSNDGVYIGPEPGLIHIGPDDLVALVRVNVTNPSSVPSGRKITNAIKYRER